MKHVLPTPDSWPDSNADEHLNHIKWHPKQLANTKMNLIIPAVKATSKTILRHEFSYYI